MWIGRIIVDGIMAVYHFVNPIKMVQNGKIEEELLSLNTTTHPDYQGHRLFATLADKTCQYVAENGFKFVVGVDNPVLPCLL